MGVVKKGLVAAVTSSGNRKLGKSSTTYAAQASCPTDCVFLNAGCYAERGFVGIHLRNLNNHAVEVSATTQDVAEAEAKAIDEMDVVMGRPLRLHTVGDCATDEAARTVSAAAERYIAKGGGRVWSYTHAWRIVNRESWGAVSILASCETPEDVAAAHKRGYATSIVIEEFEGKRRYETNGIEIIPCPAQTKKGVGCSDCKLCFDDQRLKGEEYTIGFAIHGDLVTKRRAHEALAAK